MIRQGNVRERRREEMHKLSCSADGRNGYRDRCGGDVRKQSEPGPFNPENPYDGINDVLGQLGFSGSQNNSTLHHAPLDAHYNHFHIDLRAPVRKPLPQNLLANTAGIPSITAMSDTLIARAQSLLEEVKADLNLTQGEVTMFIPDMPNVPPQNVPVMIAQANQAQAGNPAKIRTLGVCSLVPNHNYSLENVRDPILSVRDYLEAYEHRTAPGSATTTILQQPKHGVLRLVTQADVGTILPSGGDPVDPAAALYFYLPDSNYVGKDTASIQVDFGNGLKFNVKFYFQATDVISNDWIGDYYCGKTGPYWKISSTLDANGNSTLTSVEYQSPVIDTATLAATLSSSVGSLFGTTGITLNFADLPAGALGQTTGNAITLDTTAAGNNWYIDPTPSDNSEYLPTSNPNEWVAKAGSAAAGKMDMLSVLLHEYGHALGIDHNPDAHDYMGTTLTAGIRCLPTPDELALMGQLVAQAKAMLASTPHPNPLPQGARGLGQAPSPLMGEGGGRGWIDTLTTNGSNDVPNPFPTLPLGGMSLAFAGLLQRNRYGGLNAVLNDSTLSLALSHQGRGNVVQYAVAANSTLVNGNLNASSGWATQGSVNIGNGVATLSEVSTTQTRLNQVFMVNANDRYLSFTLSGTALDDLNGAPDDAFEVALLDANSGASLLGSNGLTHSDAFLNLQADGTEHLASGVTRINNADGSRTYRVDLSGVASGTAVNLSFDLIGFGQSNSHVNISDVRLSGLPQLHDDAVTLLEDGTLSFNPYAQVITGSFTSTIVDAPAHGAVTMNADGTFSYTPTLNYNGTDSFTYRLNDPSTGSGQAPLQSNLATVNITLTAVNDAPVAADVALTTAEDTALVITLGAYASDVDSTVLTTSIVTAPLHGVLVANADGTYRYTPSLNYNGADSFTYKVNDGLLDSNLATVSLNVTAVNDAPVAADASVTTAEDTSLVIDLRTYVTDVDSSVFAATIINAPTHGVLVANADGTYSYTPNLNYNGTDSFTYIVNDPSTGSGQASLDSNVATVSLNVTAVNDAPTLGDLNLTTLEDTALAMNLLAAASDVDGNALTATIVAGALHGQVTLNADGSFTYLPDLNYNGADSFTYRVNDGLLDSNVATVTLAIDSVSDAPQGADTTVTTLEDTAYTFQLGDFGFSDALDATSNAGANSLAAVIIGNTPLAGLLTHNGIAVVAGQHISAAEIAAGLLRFTPAANANLVCNMMRA